MANTLRNKADILTGKKNKDSAESDKSSSMDHKVCSLGKRKSSEYLDDEQNSSSRTSVVNESESPSKIVKTVKPIKMSLATQKPKEPVPVQLAKKPITVAAAFGDDSDSEPEDMPAEARMRMKNIGRETPTAAGPNSFGKTKFGFTDTQRMHERMLKDVAKHVDG